jgi:hypothetical protein
MQLQILSKVSVVVVVLQEEVLPKLDVVVQVAVVVVVVNIEK